MDRLSNRRRFLKRGALFVPTAFGILRAQNIMPGPIMRPMAAGGAPSYLIDENFDGSGTPSGWTDRAPINYDYDVSGFGAPFSDEGMAPGADGGSTAPLGAAYSEAFLFCNLRFSASAAEDQAIRFQDATTGNIFQLGLQKVVDDIRPRPICGATNGDAIITALSLDTNYYVWLHGKNNGGATSVCDIEFSTTSTRLGSGNLFSSTTGTVTTDITKVFFYRVAWVIYIDNVKVSATDYPTP